MTKYIGKVFAVFVILQFLLLSVSAQVKDITIKGKITDEKGQPMPYVSVIVKSQPGIGTVSDEGGNFRIKAGENDYLVFNFLGYEKQEMAVSGKTTITISLKPSIVQMEEVTVVGQGVQRKVSVVGAISTLDVKNLSVTGGQLSNSLAGNIAGVIAVQRSGEPGKNKSEFWIRGISTFGANASAMVLVDGIERGLNEISPEDIASFSILKDASATAIYGSRGANGVVIINTKRGVEGKMEINFKTEYGLNSPTGTPTYAEGGAYATLANEAAQTRGRDYIYSPAELEIIRYGLDKDLYPNINWRKELMKATAPNKRGVLTIRGGTALARYYISAGYNNEKGMFKYGNVQQYNTNIDVSRYNFRSNLDVNLTGTTVLRLGLGGWIEDQDRPAASGDMWNAISNLSPIATPKEYSNGLAPAYGTGNLMSPYVLLTNTGYNEYSATKVETNIELSQDLKFITPGLKFTGRFSYDTWNDGSVSRLHMPDIYRAGTQRDATGNLILRKIASANPLALAYGASSNKRFYTEASVNYDRTFGKHRIGGLLFYFQQDFSQLNGGLDIRTVIPARNQALSGRATYSYDDKYMAEFNFGYTGSENFEKKSRFGLFPAIAVGYMISNEPFMKPIDWISSLKIRASYGEVGNDRLGTRFPYITTVRGGNGYIFGPGLVTDVVGAQNLTWEVAKKYNIGVDMLVFKDFNVTVDIFQDNRDKIFMLRGNINYVMGLSNGQMPWANVGIMQSKGIDGTMSYSKKIGEVSLNLRGNLTYATNQVIDYDEASNSLYYQQTRGYKWSQNRGLIAEGLFKDKDDIANSPLQTYGPVLPGDIKYKDVNGDGLINDRDIVPISNTRDPSVIYGFGLSLNYKSFDASVLFQGAGNSDFFLNGNAAYPFTNGEVGNVLDVVNNPANRWISRDISGTIATENVNAMFPRLSYGYNANNNRESTLWLRNARYLRLKNLELGYSLPNKFIKKCYMSRARLYLIAANLLTISDFKLWDPELGDRGQVGAGLSYPLMRTVTFGLNVTF